jgi:iron-only hydrogenase group A
MTIYVNDKSIEAKAGETVLSVLKREGIDVPTLCHIEGLSPTGACRICVVELEDMNNRLVPSCSFLVYENMKVLTHSTKAIQARKTIIELLLNDHPDDCLYCVRQGNCDLSELAQQYRVRQRMKKTNKITNKLDISSPSIVRDSSKCILCGKCVRVCEEIQGVSAIDFINRGSNAEVACAFENNLNVSSCINCGQCIRICPTAALSEKDSVNEVIDALKDKNKVVVIQHAPSISVTIAEEFGVKPGVDICGKMTKAFKDMGFDYVFDTSYSADLTIMEEGSELVHRIKNGGKLPMMTSCSPGWIKFAEQFYPDFLDNLSTCKSPQQMLGAITKSYFAEKNGINPENIYMVSVMPCTAKKFEAKRPELADKGLADIDAVLTTRETSQLIKLFGIDLKNIDTAENDLPFGERSTAGKLFGNTGGVMEAALRSAYFLITGEELKDLQFKAVRGMQEIKETKVKIGDLELGVAVVSGLKNAHKLLNEIQNGRDDLHFIEVMTCPGGCVNGGGQPIGYDPDAVKARMQKLYQIDLDEPLKVSHKNPAIQALYEDFLQKPLGEKSHKLLHTKYEKREVIK